MGQLGLHLRVSEHELAAVQAHAGYTSMIDYITNELEEIKFESGDVAESDKSWAYIHSAMLGIDPDGPLEREPEDASLADASDARYVIMGRELLESSDNAYIGLTRASDVPAVAAALGAITVEDLGRRVARAHQRFGATGEADQAAEYAASWFIGLVEFYRTTAQRGENVLFSVYF
jgi:hypothetical protein